MRKYRYQQTDKLFYFVFFSIVINAIVKSVQAAINKTSNSMFMLFMAIAAFICALIWASIRGTNYKTISTFIFMVLNLLGSTIFYVLASRDQLPDYIKVT